MSATEALARLILRVGDLEVSGAFYEPLGFRTLRLDVAAGLAVVEPDRGLPVLVAGGEAPVQGWVAAPARELKPGQRF